MKLKFTLALVGAAMMAATNANATNWFCSPAGNGEKDGTSWENAASAESLVAALSNSLVSAGDNVYLMEGTYATSAAFSLPMGITIKGGYPTTMTGTNTDITYPTTANSVFEGFSGTAPLITVTGTVGDYENAQKITIYGVTIQNATNTITSNYKGSAMSVSYAKMEMGWCKFLNNVCTASNSGAIQVVSSWVYAHDCHWEGNKSNGVGYCYRVEMKNSIESETIFDRCSFIDNTCNASSTTNNYGGSIVLADKGNTLYMNNCTLSGSEFIKGKGAFCRIGADCKFYSINNTILDCKSGVPANGNMLSSKGHCYIANTIIVNSSEKAANYDLWFQYDKNMTTVSSIEYCKNNVFGSVQIAVPDTSIDDTNSTGVTSETVFGADYAFIAGGNGTKVIAPLETYRYGLTVPELEKLAEEWKLPEEIDVTVDQRGYYRHFSNKTMIGAYDPSADPVTGVENTFADNAGALKVSALGNGNFAVNVEGVACVYDLSGKLIKSMAVENGVIGLGNVAKGVYVIRVNTQATKVVL